MEIFYMTCYKLVVFLGMIQFTISLRRIKHGQDVETDKKYMVYLLGAPSAPRQYQGWMCGGAILSEQYVITSAACVEDVKHMYVISGYKTYIPSDRMEEDQCVLQKRKKIVQTCVPTSYTFDFNKTEIWTKLDIAIVKVESPFDFNDKSYESVCSYIPQPIEYNTEMDFPPAGEYVIVLGWGHLKEYRQTNDFQDYNQAILKYAPTKVLDEKICAQKFDKPELASVITASMICTLGMGNLNDKGSLIKRSKPAGGCITQAQMLRGAVGKMCEYEEISEGVSPPVELDYGAYQEIVDKEVKYARKQGNNTIPHLTNYTGLFNNTTEQTNSTPKNNNISIQNSSSTSIEISDVYVNTTSTKVMNAKQYNKETGINTKIDTNHTTEHDQTIIPDINSTTKYDKNTEPYSNFTNEVNKNLTEKVMDKIKSNNYTKVQDKKTINGRNIRRIDPFNYNYNNYNNYNYGYPTPMPYNVNNGYEYTYNGLRDDGQNPNGNGEATNDTGSGGPTSKNDNGGTANDKESGGSTNKNDNGGTGSGGSTNKNGNGGSKQNGDKNGNEDDYGESPGICQNDHGGPLIAWRGGSEVLIAVATLFKLNNRLECEGPYLFTKTACNQKFIDCIVNQGNAEKDDTRRACDNPAEMGFEIVRRHISWVGHRDGPAENERVQIRQQVPISAFQPGIKQVNARLTKKQKFG